MTELVHWKIIPKGQFGSHGEELGNDESWLRLREFFVTGDMQLEALGDMEQCISFLLLL